MFESLKAGISKAINSIKDYGKITESNISTTVKDIRKILIKSDVNYNLANLAANVVLPAPCNPTNKINVFLPFGANFIL